MLGVSGSERMDGCSKELLLWTEGGAVCFCGRSVFVVVVGIWVGFWLFFLV